MTDNQLSIFDQGPYPPCPAPFNMAAHVLAHADKSPDKVALAILSMSGSERWSYGRLKSAILGTGAGLLRSGLKPGDIVLLRLGNNVDFPIAYLGAIAVGLVPVPTSTQLTETEVADMIETLAPAAIVLGRGIACPVDHDIPLIDDETLTGFRDLPPAEFDMGDPNRMAYIVFTSGTSGKPRAVVHGHRAIWARQMMHQGWYGMDESDRLFHAGAFNWTYTMGTGLMDPWSLGATALIPAAGITAEQIPLLLKRHDATLLAAAPGVYRKILNGFQGMVPGKLRHGLTAGEKLSNDLRKAWRDAGFGELFEAFGMSECSTFISSSPNAPCEPQYLGRPQNGRRVAIVDEQGNPVPLGEDGTIAISKTDPGLMIEYLNAPEETAARFQGEWFLTGDHGAMRADGQIEYHARVDDMMNAGGYRVSPLEVEAAMQGFPGLSEVAVTDVEIKRDVRLIAGFYTANEPLDNDQLSTHAASRLARYKQPRFWVHIPELPRNANGKLLRQALKSMFRP